MPFIISNYFPHFISMRDKWGSLFQKDFNDEICDVYLFVEAVALMLENCFTLIYEKKVCWHIIFVTDGQKSFNI